MVHGGPLTREPPPRPRNLPGKIDKLTEQNSCHFDYFHFSKFKFFQFFTESLNLKTLMKVFKRHQNDYLLMHHNESIIVSFRTEVD